MSQERKPNPTIERDGPVRAKNAILGALVADAAALGLHWIYDQERIREVAGNTPEFREPDASAYEGVPSFFAHGKKRAGDLSHYGEQALVLLRSLVESDGELDAVHYERRFRDHFGPGGEYVGYIDSVIRDTLYNASLAEHEAIDAANALPFDGDEALKHRLVTKVMSNVSSYGGEELRRRVEGAVRMTHDDDAIVAHAFKILEEIQARAGYHGAEDVQMPAISKLPALVARYAGTAELAAKTEAAVRVTNNDDIAVAFGLAAARMMEAAIAGEDLQAVVQAGLATDDDRVRGLIDKAISLDGQDHAPVAKSFGLSCNLEFGLPIVAHNLLEAGSFAEAVRRNILAGGDSCGRGILLGAVLGAAYGVGGERGIPDDWLKKLSGRDDIVGLIEALPSES